MKGMNCSFNFGILNSSSNMHFIIIFFHVFLSFSDLITNQTEENSSSMMKGSQTMPQHLLKYSTFSIMLSLPILICLLYLVSLHRFTPNPNSKHLSLDSNPVAVDIHIRRNYDSYDTYIERQLRKTLDPNLRKVWTSRDWERKIRVFSAFFSDLMSAGLLSNGSRALCVGARMGQEVEALMRIGVTDSIGIDLVPYPPLVMKGDFHRQPFSNESFDFEFSNVFDHALYPWRFVGEIERTLKVGGVCALHVALRRRGDKYSANDLYSLKALEKMLRFSKIVRRREIDGFGLDTEVVFRKRNSLS